MRKPLNVIIITIAIISRQHSSSSSSWSSAWIFVQSKGRQKKVRQRETDRATGHTHHGPHPPRLHHHHHQHHKMHKSSNKPFPPFPLKRNLLAQFVASTVSFALLGFVTSGFNPLSNHFSSIINVCSINYHWRWSVCHISFAWHLLLFWPPSRPANLIAVSLPGGHPIYTIQHLTKSYTKCYL